MNTNTSPMTVKLLSYFKIGIRTLKILNTNFHSRHKSMKILKGLTLISSLLVLATLNADAQIEVARVSLKNFKAFGLAGFLNFSLPLSEADYLTIEGGFQYFKDKNDNDLTLVPALIGYRYTINQTGTGFYLEPNAGYCFGASNIQKYNAVGSPIAESDGSLAVEKVAGPVAGLGIGYLFAPSGNIQFNVAIRYERTFGESATNVFAFRISHAFTFRRSEE
jgi:hypothetical protein